MAMMLVMKVDVTQGRKFESRNPACLGGERMVIDKNLTGLSGTPLTDADQIFLYSVFILGMRTLEEYSEGEPAEA